MGSKKLQEFDPDKIYDEFDEFFNGGGPKYHNISNNYIPLNKYFRK